MIGTKIMLLFCFFANSIRTALLLSMRELQNNEVIVDINKGYALRRIGSYSANMEEEIVHTFLPLNNFCEIYQQTDVCVYASQPTRTNVVSLATILKSFDITYVQSSYSRENISRLINKDLSQVLLNHDPHDIMKNPQSIVHFYKNQFYYEKNMEAPSAATSENTVDNYPGVSFIRPTPIGIILNQIIIKKIGFEFLSQNDLKFFLTVISANSYSSYIENNVLQESLDTFTESVLSQSVSALRYCSFVQHNVVSSRPCLIVSTLFSRVPHLNRSTFFVFNLIPLPTVNYDFQYIYTDLPKIVGINSIDESIMLWKQESDVKNCILSRVVRCRSAPASTFFAKSSCLSQLLDDSQIVTTNCKVSRSSISDEGVLRVADGLWYFHHILKTQYCDIYSTSTDTVESISITEPLLLHIPCHKTAVCPTSKLPASTCTQARLSIIHDYRSNINYQSHFLIPLRNMSQTIMTTYQKQYNAAIDELVNNVASRKTWFQIAFEKIITYVVSILSILFLILFMYLTKIVKNRLEQKIASIQTLIQDIIQV